MGYIDRVLRPDEEVLAIGRMHWIIYLRGAMLLVIALALLFAAGNFASFASLAATAGGWLVGLFAVYDLAASAIEAWTTEIAVTNRRVIHKRGLIRRETGEMNMEKVESVTVDQSILGRILNYGSIVVRGTGAGIEGLHHIGDPLTLRSAIVVR